MNYQGVEKRIDCPVSNAYVHHYSAVIFVE